MTEISELAALPERDEPPPSLAAYGFISEFLCEFDIPVPSSFSVWLNVSVLDKLLLVGGRFYLLLAVGGNKRRRFLVLAALLVFRQTILPPQAFW